MGSSTPASFITVHDNFDEDPVYSVLLHADYIQAESFICVRLIQLMIPDDRQPFLA